MTLEEFYKNCCLPCGNPYCGGVYDASWREGCSRYRSKIMREPSELNPYNYENLIAKNVEYMKEIRRKTNETDSCSN